ncbi:MAG: 16S rRNA (cytidine(1402)-2'-O)-methyltransferase [Gemmatimonadota bacterium]
MATLFIVSTPIGNLGDLSERAADVLRRADRILAEDTRRSRVLADHVGATCPLVSLHAHNESERTRAVLEWLEAGQTLALVSDAGTPLVSDPGGRLVPAVVAAGHAVVPIPGASAVMAALVGSGFDATRFTMLGFPARKGRDRDRDLTFASASPYPVVLFESPQRLVKLLEELAVRSSGAREVCVARELTKLHEEFRRGTLEDVAAYYREHPPKGEVTLVVEGHTSEESPEDRAVRAAELATVLLGEGRRASDVAKEVAKRLDLARNEAYRIVHDVERSSNAAGPSPEDPTHTA